MFWQFFLLNIKPFYRTVLKRLLVLALLLMPNLLLQARLLEGSWQGPYIFLAFAFTVSFFIISISDYALRIESSYINSVFLWNNKILYSYFASKFLLGIIVAVLFTTLFYIIVPMALARFLGSALLLLGFFLFVNILTIPYNKNKLDLFDKASLKSNSGNFKLGFIRIFIVFPIFILLDIPNKYEFLEYLYWIYFGIGLVLTLLFPLWLKIAVNKIINRKYILIDSLLK